MPTTDAPLDHLDDRADQATVATPAIPGNWAVQVFPQPTSRQPRTRNHAICAQVVHLDPMDDPDGLAAPARKAGPDHPDRPLDEASLDPLDSLETLDNQVVPAAPEDQDNPAKTALLDEDVPATPVNLEAPVSLATLADLDATSPGQDCLDPLDHREATDSLEALEVQASPAHPDNPDCLATMLSTVLAHLAVPLWSRATKHARPWHRWTFTILSI